LVIAAFELHQVAETICKAVLGKHSPNPVMMRDEQRGWIVVEVKHESTTRRVAPTDSRDAEGARAEASL
jgi:hypothetical protein